MSVTSFAKLLVFLNLHTACIKENHRYIITDIQKQLLVDHKWNIENKKTKKIYFIPINFDEIIIIERNKEIETDRSRKIG